MDEELARVIDAAIDEARAVGPAPDFVPRLRAHVEQLPARAPIRWWIPLAASASAVAAGVIVAALVRIPRQDARPAAVVVARPSPAPPAAPADPPRSARANDGARLPASRAARKARPAPRDANAAVVLVPPGQLAALGRLADAISAGDEGAAATVRRLGTSSGAIVIQPIQIEPVAVPPLKESM